MKKSVRKEFALPLPLLFLVLATVLGILNLLGLVNFYRAPGWAQTVAEPRDKAKPQECGVPMTEARVPFRHSEQALLYDEFEGATLGPEYEISDGPGDFELRGGESFPVPGPTGRFLRYYALPRGVEFSGEAELINIDYLGRPYAPSLLIARPFTGETWAFDTKVTYGFERPSNGRAVSIWITFSDITERSKNAVKITRYNDNPGRPKDRGSLGVTFFSNASKQGISKDIPLNEHDSYFFCIRRKGRNVEVLVSNDGISYSPVLEHAFGPEIDQKGQWLIINGSAFAPGAYADIEYLSVRAPAHEAVTPLPFERALFQRYGSPNQRIGVDAEEIKKAFKEGKNVAVRFANVTGVLDLSEINSSAFKNQVTFKSCSLGGLIGGGITFGGDVSFVNCNLGHVNFSGSEFKGKVDFSGSTFHGDTRFILAKFNRGADYSGATFKRRTFFRLTRFDQPTSFYFSNFEEGADFSSTGFEKDVSFSDFSFSKPETAAAFKPDTTFFGSTFKGKAMFISGLQRPVAPLGDEVSFQQSDIRELIISSGDPNPFTIATEQTGKGLWVIGSNISLLDAKVGTVTLKNVSFKGVTDLRGVTFRGGKDSVRLLNADFTDLKFDSWPVGKVLATPETRGRLTSVFEAANNTIASRTAFFDLLAVSKYYEKWLRNWLEVDAQELSEDLAAQFNVRPGEGVIIRRVMKDGAAERGGLKEGDIMLEFNGAKMENVRQLQGLVAQTPVGKIVPIKVLREERALRLQVKNSRPNSYRDYPGYRVRAAFLGTFWAISGYGTSLIRTFLTGFALTFLFAGLFFFVDRGHGHLLRIEKPMELKTRLSETPVLSFGEKVIQVEEVPKPAAVSRLRRILAAIQSHLKRAVLAFLFSLNTVAKIGFGNIRVRMGKGSPKILVGLAWAAWVIGYAWYILLIYTLSVIPVLKGLF